MGGWYGPGGKIWSGALARLQYGGAYNDQDYLILAIVPLLCHCTQSIRATLLKMHSSGTTRS